MASGKSFEDLDLSHEEIKRIETALKDEKFRKMFIEYAEEISNPENRKRYEEEIAMLEKERGMDVEFINPEPGHVLKTTAEGKKAFINICKSDKIGKPTSKQGKNAEGKKGLSWQIPHSFTPPREDFDKAKETCMVYDVVFHPDTYRMTSNPNFLKLVEDTAIDGIERQFDIKLDRNNIHRPKMQSKGKLVSTVIRNRKDGEAKKPVKKEDDPLASMPYPYADKSSAELAEEKNKQAEQRSKAAVTKENKTKSNNLKKEEDGFTSPKYHITHRSDMDLQEYRNAPDSRPTTRPKELVVTIELPLCKSAAGVDLDIFEDRLTLKSEKPAYKLDVKLPYPVDDENGSAKFDKSKKSLIVTLPVVPGEIPAMPSFIDKAEGSNIPPLIEELAPLEVKPDTVEDIPADLPPLEEIEDAVEQVTSGIAEYPKEETKTNTVSYNMPDYDFNQDQETVTFVFHVRNISEESVCNSFPQPGEFVITFVSLGSGGFPMHYRFIGQFGKEFGVVPEHCTLDVSDRNMTFTLLKQKECRSLWNKFLAGHSKDTLEEKLFVTTDNLQGELDKLQLEGEKMGQTDEHAPGQHPSNIKVTEMNEKRLTLKIGKQASSLSEEEEDLYKDEDEVPSSSDIEVVHSHKLPNLHGILKQRSMSESSEDHLSLSSGESPTGCSPRDSDGKRSVTFNSHIDKTTYKTTASPSSMKQALKSKRRRNRKKEERKEKGNRRRHNSTGSEYSSCDDDQDNRQSSESHSEDDPETPDILAEQLEQTGKKVDHCGVIEEGQEDVEERGESEDITEDVTKADGNDASKQPGYQIHSESEKKESKLAAEVKSQLEKLQQNSAEDSDDDVGAEDSERTSEKSGEENVKTRNENARKVVNVTSKQSENVKNDENVKNGGNDLSITGNGNNVLPKAAKQDSGQLDTPSDTAGDKKKKNKSGKGKDKGVKFKDDEKEGMAAEKGDGDKQSEVETTVETELSWKETNRTAPFNEHRSQCAFDFSNNVMFDLDID